MARVMRPGQGIPVEPSAPPDATPSSVPYGRDARAAAVRGIAAIMIEHLHGLSVRSASEIWNREVEFRESMGGPEQLYEPCRITMGAALGSLVSGRLDDGQVHDVRAVGRAASEQGMPLEVVLRALRVDFLVLWSEMLLVARTTDPSTQQSLINASEIVWGAVDAVTAQFTIGYRSNHEARARAEAVRRHEVLMRVLKGEHVARSSLQEVLGLDVGEDYVVFVVEPSSGVTIDELARAVRYASMHSVWAERGADLVGMVVLRGQSADAAIDVVSRVREVRAGVARTRRAIADAPAALEEATLALASSRTRSVGPTIGVVSILDDPMSVLVVAQPSLVDDLVSGLLAPLFEAGCRDREVLLETLLAFDACNGVLPEVAESTFCHRNTVLNRLTKITRLTGISFNTPAGLALVALVARALRAGMPVELHDT